MLNLTADVLNEAEFSEVLKRGYREHMVKVLDVLTGIDKR